MDAPSGSLCEQLTVVDLNVGKVAMATRDGRYLSPRGGADGSVIANSPGIGDWEKFDLISFGRNRIAFRAINGEYLQHDTSAGNKLIMKGGIEKTSIFTYKHLQF